MNIDNQLQNDFNTKDFGGALKGALNNPALNEGGGQYLTPGRGEGGFRSELEKIIQSANTAVSEFDVDDVLDSMDIAAFKDIDTQSVSRDDAIFYINLLNEGNIVNYTVSNSGNVTDIANYKSIDVSKTLTNLLAKASETKKAIRLDFDNNVTVILKLSNEGKIDARFIPGDKAVEEYLKNNIPYLKQRFDEENIPYANLSYKQHRQRENGQNSKEKNNE